MTIIALLLLIALAAYVPATAAATRAACLNNQKVLDRAASVAAASDAPADELSDLESGVANFEDVRKCPKDGTPLTFDPVLGSVACPNHPR